jgi:hypothetical protein
MMLRTLTSGLIRLLLTATLLGALAGSAAAHRDECPMAGMHDCCKKARQKQQDAPGVEAARLCCIVNCSQPAPTGTNFTFQSSPGAANTPQPRATQAPSAPAATQSREYSPPFQPSHSPPVYIRHAAFLI